MRVNYAVNNYCCKCDKKFPKSVLDCDDCHNQLRKRGHKSN